MRCVDIQAEKMYDYHKLHNLYTEDSNYDYLLYYGRLTKIDLFTGRKHKTCPICGKGFYRKKSNNKKYCSDECYRIANAKRSYHYKSLGTPATTEINLNNAKSIHKEVERIRKGGNKPVYENESFYEVERKNCVYRFGE